MQAFASCVLQRTCAFSLCANATETAQQLPNYLLRLGEGSLKSAEDGMVELPESVQKVLDTVFHGLASNYSDVSWLISRSILSTKT